MTWERRSWIDAVADRVGSALVRHARLVVFLALAALAVALVLPFAPVLRTPAGAALSVGAVAPLLVAALALSRLDRTSKEPVVLLATTFLFGALLATVAALVNAELSYLPIWIKLVLVVGPGEEIVKVLAVVLVVWTRPEFDDAIDGLFYGLCAGAGFAAIENLVDVAHAQVAGGDAAALSTLVARAAVSAPAHAIWSGIAGYFVGIARFMPQHRAALLTKGIGIAAVAHAAHDIIVRALPDPWSVVVAALLAAALGAWLVAKARRYFRFHGLA